MEVPIGPNKDAVYFAKKWFDEKITLPHDKEFEQLSCIIGQACRDYYEQKTRTRP